MAESGTCNVCSAPCASCMHFNRLVTGIKTEGSSSEVVCANTNSHHSANSSAVVNSLKRRSFDNIQDTASATSCYESVSENKEMVRAHYSSEDVSYPDISTTGSPGRGQVPRSLAISLNVEVSDKCDQKRSEACFEGHDEYLNGMDYAMVDKGNNNLDFNKLQNFSRVNDSGVVKLLKGDNSQNPSPNTGTCVGINEGSDKKFDKDRKDSTICYHGGSTFSIVARKLELHELDFAQGNKGSPAVSSSHVSMYPRMKTEVKTKQDYKHLPEESLNVASTSRGTPNDPSKLPAKQKPSSESHSGDESEEIVEHDVNICDICGDVGREDLLATCSGCSDGAEHTYCMHEQMEKVPEGEWFCEDCRLANKIRNQRDIVEGVVKVQPYSRSRSLRRNLSIKLDSEELYVKGYRTEMHTPATQSRKRLLEKNENVIALKRHATKITKDFTSTSASHQISRDGSLKSIASEIVNKSFHQPSQWIHSLSMQPQTHKGQLSKSNSFDAISLKTNGKSMGDIPHKQKGPCEPSDAKDGASRLIARSLSLRHANLGRPNAGEPKVVMLSPKSSHAPDMKWFKKLEGPLSFDRKKAFRDEWTPNTSSSLASALCTDQKIKSWENSLVSLDLNSKDSKAFQSDAKITTLPKLFGHASRRAADMPAPDNAASTYLAFSEKKNKAHEKNERASGSCTTVKHSSNVDAILNPELSSPRDASNQLVKNGDNILTRPKMGGLISGSNLCLRCKEPITAAHVCMISTPMSAADSSAVRVSADDADKGNPVKAALYAALLKKSVICKKSKSPDSVQFDEEHVLIPNSNCGSMPQDLLSGSNYMKNSCSADKKHIGKSPLHSFSSVSGQEPSINNVNKSDFPSKEHFDGKEMMLDSVITGDGKSNTKALLAHSFFAPMPTIPMHECIWQGDFVVNRNGEKEADMLPGFQAHLSTFASAKVMDVVNKFSTKLSLTEIPRVTAWPEHFHETGATEDNIALYFFAKDIESYEKHYKILLDDMLRNDVALKGSVNGVELLIFPSSQLPQKSQRWNMLFFFWGVFRAKKYCQSQVAGLSRVLDAPGRSCVLASDGSPSIPMTVPPALDSLQLDYDSVRHSESEHYSGCGHSCSKWRSTNNYGEEHTVGLDCEIKPNDGTAITATEGMFGDKCVGSANDGRDTSSDCQELDVVSQGIDSLGNDKNEAGRVKLERKIKNEESDVKPNLKKEPSMENSSVEKCEYGQSNDKTFTYGKPSLKEYECGQSNDKTSLHVDLTGKSIPVFSREASNSMLASSDSKDLTISCSFYDAHCTGPRISSKKIMYDLNLDARHFLEESGTAEGFLSAKESPQVVDFQGASSAGWDLNSSANDIKVDDDSEGWLDPVVPSLGLALCDDTESFPRRNGTLPMFVKMAEPCAGAAERKVDAPAASLSLSLAFPCKGENQLSIRQATTSTEKLHGPVQVNQHFLLPADK